MDWLVSNTTLSPVVLAGVPIVVGAATLLLFAFARQPMFMETEKRTILLRFLAPVLVVCAVVSGSVGLMLGLASSGIEREQVIVRTTPLLDCIFVFDGSGSMGTRQGQRDLVVKIEEYMAEHAGGARCSTIAFSDDAVEVVAHTHEHALILGGIEFAQDQLSGGTNISAGIQRAYQAWQRAGKPSSIKIFLVSDLLDGNSGEYLVPVKALLTEGADVTIVWVSAGVNRRTDLNAQVVELRASGAAIVPVESEEGISNIPLSFDPRYPQEQRIAPSVSGHIPPNLLIAGGLLMFVLFVTLFPWVRWR
ncbi:MAG: hypothetical protein A3A30_05305 [Candidatus Terrybacteria bacterium RIFCSPLOWO2_01_FULL_48_14]|nr:MAG: hypothetical protein A3A30_05305 [Candidatus Terrybacteria bacterium RIFCSPLOWO2_01_FULL_48_14]